MPYQRGLRLPAEKASKLGHLEVIKCPLVQKLCQNFEDPNYTPEIMMQTEPEKECTDPIQKVMTRNNCNFREQVPHLWQN